MLQIGPRHHRNRESQNYNKLKYQRLVAIGVKSEISYNTQKDDIDRSKEKIKIVNISCSNWSFFEKDLMKMKNLMKLSISRVQFSQNSTKISIHSLKELEVQSNNFIHFDVPNLVKFTYGGPCLPIDFLKSCNKLTHLTYRMKSRGNREVLTELSDITQSLTYLKVSVRESTSIIPLLKSQKNSLKHLVMENNSQHGEIEYAINQMKLEKLNVFMSSDLKMLTKNSTIKELKINQIASRSVLRAIKTVLKSCSSTKKLILSIKNAKQNRETINIASEYLPNLNHLSIKEQLGKPLNLEGRFDSMESMVLSLDRNEEVNLILLSKCPNLKKIDFDWPHEVVDWDYIEPISSDYLQRILSKVPDLEELISDKILKLNDNVIKLLQNSKIRILKITVSEEDFESQQKLAIQLCKQRNILSTVFVA